MVFKNVQPRFSTHVSYACYPHIRDIHYMLTSQNNQYLCSFRAFVVHDVSLSYSSLPNEGVVQITTDNGTMNVCSQSLQQNYDAMSTVCRHLGHDSAHSFVNISPPTDANATFSGSINCNSGDRYLSQCSINASASESCSELSYIRCKCGEIKRIE